MSKGRAVPQPNVSTPSSALTIEMLRNTVAHLMIFGNLKSTPLDVRKRWKL